MPEMTFREGCRSTTVRFCLCARLLKVRVVETFALTVKNLSMSIHVGIYPYEAAISTKQLMEETDIPPIEAFFSKVSNSTVTQEEYEHARNVFRTFRCPSLLAYTQLYCRLDTILLASAFLSFREEVSRSIVVRSIS